MAGIHYERYEWEVIDCRFSNLDLHYVVRVARFGQKNVGKDMMDANVRTVYLQEKPRLGQLIKLPKLF